MTQAHDALLDKLRKLKAIAEDPNISEAEAALYAEKVAALLAQHNLSESSLAQEDQDPIDASTEYDAPGLAQPWRRDICLAVGRLYFCHGFTHTRYRRRADGRLALNSHGQYVEEKTYKWIGRPHNAVVAKEMSHYLIRTTTRLARTYTKDHDGSNRDLANFERACASRLSERLYQLYRDQAKRNQPTRSEGGNPSNLPALYADEEGLIASFKKTLGLQPMRGAGSSVFDTRAGRAGRSAGDTVSLSTQMRGPAAGRLLS